MDNATNNDTMMRTLEQFHRAEGYEFDAEQSRLRCLPHTVHLAAIEVNLSQLEWPFSI
jgi:hypothetical protein